MGIMISAFRSYFKQLSCEREQWCDYANDNCISRYDVEDLIQQKINALKEA